MPTVSGLVRAQLGFEVILLDCKLYPIADTEATSGLDYWKSTCKNIAASRSLYEHLGGVPPGAALTVQEDDDIVIFEPSAKKAKKNNDCSLKISLEDIHKKLDSIDSKVSFSTNLRKALECIICRSTVKMPVVSPCCQRIIGCKWCVERWASTKSSCPLCSARGRLSQTIQLKGPR